VSVEACSQFPSAVSKLRAGLAQVEVENLQREMSVDGSQVGRHRANRFSENSP